MTCRPRGAWAESTDLQPTVDIVCAAALRLLSAPEPAPGVFAPEMFFDLQWLLEDLAPVLGLGDPGSLIDVEVEERG